MAEGMTAIDADGEVVIIDLPAGFAEAIDADMHLERGELPPVGELALRPARGARDTLSQATARVAAQLWRQTGRRGFRNCLTRWRAAAMLTLRLFAAWLADVFGWEIRYLAEVEAVGTAAPVPAWELPPIRAADLIGRCHPPTGPPAVAAALGAPVILP